MKIAVCVKHVPEGPSRLDSQTFRLDRSGEGALNHFDANAVEEALRLKGESDTEVVAVSLGPQRALDSLRKALAMGADRAVLVSDDAAAGSDLVATSRLLAARGRGTRTRPVRPAGTAEAGRLLYTSAYGLSRSLKSMSSQSATLGPRRRRQTGSATASGRRPFVRRK
jgi:hypothetical protein